MADENAGTSGNEQIGCELQEFDTYCASSSMTVSDAGIAVFASNATTEQDNIYVHNLNTGETDLLSQNSSGTVGNGGSILGPWPTISYDGKNAAYDSNATNLVTTTDSNSATDVFTSVTGY